MSNFEKSVDFILNWEGQISDNPLDSGGLTKYGIAARFFPQVRDPNFTRENAIGIYWDKYWLACKCDKLPAEIAFVLFDAAVNQGQPAAIRMLQKSLQVPADGIVGPETIEAAQHATVSTVLADFVARRAFAYALVPTVQRFGLGWYRRLTACHQTALRHP